MDRVRGDLVAWQNGDGLPCLEQYLQRVDTLVNEMRTVGVETEDSRAIHNDVLTALLAADCSHDRKKKDRLRRELQHVTNRSTAMCTCYPGKGAAYSKHCDNPNQNGRFVRSKYSKQMIDIHARIVKMVTGGRLDCIGAST